MKTSPRLVLVLGLVEFFISLPLFYLISPFPDHMSQGLKNIESYYYSPQLIIFYFLMILCFLQVLYGIFKNDRFSLGRFGKSILLLGLLFSLIILILSSLVVVQKLQTGKPVFFDDKTDCRREIRRVPFWKLKEATQNLKNC